MLQTREEFCLTNINARPTLRRASGPKAYTPWCRFRKCPGKIVVRFCTITLLAFSHCFAPGILCPLVLVASGAILFHALPDPRRQISPALLHLRDPFALFVCTGRRLAERHRCLARRTQSGPPQAGRLALSRRP